MHKVKWNGVSGVEKEMDFPTLDLALKFSQSLGTFVSITDGKTELVGHFGVDSIDNGILPDGTDYSWYKRRKPDAKKNREAQRV
jgi:hypothetical protein